MTTLDLVLQLVFSGLMVGNIYALIALGFNTVFNATEAIDFAQGEFVMLGGMMAVAFMTILMVEQNARLALRGSDRAYVLSTGSVVLEGPAQALLEDEAVRKAYLG